MTKHDRTGTTLSELNVELGITRETAGQMIEALEHDGRVVWANFERDGEPVFITTEKGRREIDLSNAGGVNG